MLVISTGFCLSTFAFLPSLHQGQEPWLLQLASTALLPVYGLRLVLAIIFPIRLRRNVTLRSHVDFLGGIAFAGDIIELDQVPQKREPFLLSKSGNLGNSCALHWHGHSLEIIDVLLRHLLFNVSAHALNPLD